MRKYRNLNEIDNDLRLLKLKVRLEKEKINLDIAQLKKQTEPQVLVRSLITAGIRRISILGLIRQLFRKVSR